MPSTTVRVCFTYFSMLNRVYVMYTKHAFQALIHVWSECKIKNPFILSSTKQWKPQQNDQ